jgi:hypothetical protein
MTPPRFDGKQMVYLSLALATMSTIYGYTGWAMPHIIRYITH